MDSGSVNITSFTVGPVSLITCLLRNPSCAFLQAVPCRVSKGRLLLLFQPDDALDTVYYASENSASDQDILMQTSTDGGATWTSPATVAGATTTGRDGMPGVAQFSVNGANHLVCVFETTEGTGTFTVKSVYSSDDGATWNTRTQVYVPTGTSNNGKPIFLFHSRVLLHLTIHGKIAGAPQVVTKMDGDLVVSFMTDEDTSEHAWLVALSIFPSGSHEMRWY